MICFLPVRSGSKGVPDKNCRPLAGKSLIQRYVETALDSGAFSRIVLAVDGGNCFAECEKARNQIQNRGIVSVFNRSSASASDTAATEMVLLEWLGQEKVSEDVPICLGQVTSPFLKSATLRKAADTFCDGTVGLLSVVRKHEFRWSTEGFPLNYSVSSRPRRQDWSGDLVETGAFYFSLAGQILESGARVKEPCFLFETDALESFEIDTWTDFLVAEALLEKGLI